MSDKNILVHESYVVNQLIAPTEKFPNNSKLPLLIYKGAFILKPEDQPDVITAVFKSNGYDNSWVGDVYEYDHFHSHTHEVLGIFSGTAELIFGGDEGKCLEVGRGDVIIIPAGVAHKKQKSSDNFICVGAYPDGKNIDVADHLTSEDSAAIASVPIPEKDPVYGNDNDHLSKCWKY